MDDELEKPEPKISLVVGILVLMIYAIMDAIGLIPGADDIEEVPAVIGTVLSAFFGIGPSMIILEILVDFLKAIPFVQELPLWTICWIIVWIFENHPSKLTQPIQKLVDAAAVLEGDAEAIGQESAAIEGEVASAAASAEQSSEIAADRQSLTGETSTSSSAENRSTSASSSNGEGEEGTNKKSQGQEDENNIDLGDEVAPEKQAAAEDFESKEAPYESQDEEEEQPNDKVIDIRTRKPLNRPSSRNSQDEDSQRAA